VCGGCAGCGEQPFCSVRCIMARLTTLLAGLSLYYLPSVIEKVMWCRLMNTVPPCGSSQFACGQIDDCKGADSARGVWPELLYTNTDHVPGRSYRCRGPFIVHKRRPEELHIVVC
jgi:hypothetical protein